jgi:hypothetical protein
VTEEAEAPEAPARVAPADRPSRMGQQEFISGLVVAALGVPAFLLAVREMDEPPPIVAAVALSVMIAIGSALRHRLLAGTGAILLSSVLSSDVFAYGVPFLGYASWLLFKMTKANGELARKRREAQRAVVKRELSKPEIPVRKGKKGGRVTPRGTQPRPRRK